MNYQQQEQRGARKRKLFDLIHDLLDRVHYLEQQIDDLHETQAKRRLQGVDDLEKTVASIIDPIGPLRTLAERVEQLEEWRDLVEQAE